MAHKPVGTGSSLAFSVGVASTSSAFSVQSNVLRLVAVGGDVHVEIGKDPIANSGDYYIPSGGTVTLALTKASNRVVGVTTGSTTFVTVPEGTQVPFGVGDYVSLSGSTYHNFTHQEVISIDTSSDINGYYQTRMEIGYDSSGIVTSFSSTDARVINSNKVSAYGVGSGIIYYQQVQISGDA